VGPEVIPGSTRLKAGTAQKLALNAFSTALMVRRGRTYGNLMAGMRVANAKLRERAVRICMEAAGCTETEAAAALEAAGNDLPTAVVMLVAGVDAADARGRLGRSGGAVRAAAEGPAQGNGSHHWAMPKVRPLRAEARP
jgi:N-acetylmuramic acid 6-phosphate etherase